MARRTGSFLTVLKKEKKVTILSAIRLLTLELLGAQSEDSI